MLNWFLAAGLAVGISGEVLQQLKPKIAIPMHYQESTQPLDMVVKDYPNKYLNTYNSTFSR
jgi:L-ascorbate metabolism protein UlaG (beta-lactamase superfamily)